MAATDELRKNPMMVRLLDALDAGRDIGHYGRLTFAIVAHYFLDRHELVRALTQDEDFSEAEARALVDQVEDTDYSPPRRSKIQEWQREQDFQILPGDDPDAGNVYRDLDFPEEVYEQISDYHRQKAEAQ